MELLLAHIGGHVLLIGPGIGVSGKTKPAHEKDRDHVMIGNLEINMFQMGDAANFRMRCTLASRHFDSPFRP
jgi:hypothetical protein